MLNIALIVSFSMCLVLLRQNRRLKQEIDNNTIKADAFDVAEREIEIMLDIGGEAQFDAGLKYALDAMNNAIGGELYPLYIETGFY